MAITNYNAYLIRLESIYNQYGYSVSDAILREFIVREHLDTNFGITVQDLRIDLATIHKKMSACEHTSSSLKKAPKAVSKPLSSMRQAVIKTYPEYMSALQTLYINRGKVALTDTEIQDFISINKIDIAYGITISDVKADLSIIYKRFPSPVTKTQSQVKRTLLPVKPKAKLTTYNQYMEALERLYVQNEGILSDAQLNKFITDNVIDAAFGVKLYDVKTDLQDIEKRINDAKISPITSYENYERELTAYISKYGDKAYLEPYIKKFILTHEMNDKNSTIVSDVRMDLIFIQAKKPLVSDTARSFNKNFKKTSESKSLTSDSSFKFDVAAIILKHKEFFTKDSLPRVRGLLWDYFPEKKREINVLMILASYGILEDIVLEQTLGPVFISKYVTRIVAEYAIDKNFSMEMALVWCYGYGECLLGKKLIHECWVS